MVCWAPCFEGAAASQENTVRKTSGAVVLQHHLYWGNTKSCLTCTVRPKTTQKQKLLPLLGHTCIPKNHNPMRCIHAHTPYDCQGAGINPALSKPLGLPPSGRSPPTQAADQRMTGHHSSVMCMQVLGGTLYSGGFDGTIRVRTHVGCFIPGKDGRT